jgi:hypothetical protein
VLHLHQDAVSEVLEHMEAIRKLRRRITDRLKQVRGAASVADVDAGRALLAKAEAHELKLLAELSKLDVADDKDDDDDVRLSVAQCKAMLVQHATRSAPHRPFSLSGDLISSYSVRGGMEGCMKV